MGEEQADLTPELARQLRAYGALDNPIRLRAYRMIHDSPEASFNDIVRRLEVASGLAAYHLGVLKAADLIEVTYVRKGMATSRYALTDLGTRIFENLSGRRPSNRPRISKSRSHAPA